MKTEILLVDNGSRSPAAVHNLRRIAQDLSKQTGKTITAVPLQHANKIPAADLGGETAKILKDALAESLQQGTKDFIVLPLFFGLSRAVTSFIPDTLSALEETYGKFNCRIADVLCPLPQGEPLLAQLLLSNLESLSLDTVNQVILVDHGSPSKQVADVRVKLAEQLSDILPSTVTLLQAAMERREGKEYDFTGTLLIDQLETIASSGTQTTVALSMLFISPGRHAGKDGDIDEICAQAMQKHPHLNILVSPLVGDSTLLLDLLEQRLVAV